MATALTQEPAYISEKEYLAGELESDIKHEYVDGHVYAMTGGTRNHAGIAGNMHAHLWNFLRGKKCDVYQSDLKIRTPEGNHRYPDVVVICSDSEESDTDSPVILMEVLSSSTRQRDKVIKKREYLSIPTLKEYVLIEQDFVEVEVFRQENNWRSDYYFLGDEVHLASIGCRINVEEIYERVVNEDMVAFLQAKAEERKEKSP